MNDKKRLFGNENLPELRLMVITIEEYTLYLYYTPELENVIQEANKRGERDLPGRYSVSKHKPHTTEGEYHLHIYDRNNQIGSINQSGKGHDGYSGTQLPKKIIPQLQKLFRQFKIPDDGIIES